MSETLRLALPLVAPAQAQKHVTVNEAFARIDALAQLVLASRTLAVPPAVPAEGVCHGVPVAATGAWAGKEGKLALFLNGGWSFVAPVAGWRAWVGDEGTPVTFDGVQWVAGVMSLSPFGAGALWRVAEITHVLTAGGVNTTTLVIPDKAMVFGVTARVVTALTGTLGTWQLGSAGAPDRFGSGLGKAAGAFAQGVLGQPTTYYGSSPVIVTPSGGTFAAGGVVRIAAHYMELTVPGA